MNIVRRMTGLALPLLFLLPFLDAAPSNHQLHTLMTDAEKDFYFGEAAPMEYEVIEVFRPKSERKGTRDVHFHASGQQFKLQMKPNKRLLAPQAMIVKRTHGSLDKAGNRTGDDDLARVETEEDCHYLHKDNDTVAALNLCSDSDTTGIVISAKRTLEILPLNTRLKRMMDVWKDDNSTEPKNERNSRESKSLFQKRNLHLVKRTEHKHTPKFDIHMKQEANGDFDDDVMFDTRNTNLTETKEKRKISKRSGGNKVLETAVFLDAAAYKRFAGYFSVIGKPDVDTEVKRLLLSYMNGIQAVYILPSLREEIDISIVRIEMWTNDPFTNYQGDREPLLNSFCEYQESINPRSDDDAAHWDVALLVSGLNFYAVDSRGRKNGVTMGLARVGGMCTNQHNCVIGELGVTNSRGKPYPSAGFTAVFVMAHEIGHNLGMHHDHSAGCPKNGFIMSASRGTKGESQWSSCSVDALNHADLSCLNENTRGKVEDLDMAAGVFPGEVWSASRQCQIFLLDKDAHIDHTESTYPDMCYSIKCRTPRREGYYRAGPALEGTACGAGFWCRAGECVRNIKPAVDGSAEPGKWSEWRRDSCQSGCTEGSMGFRLKTRECKQSRLVHTLDGCRGPATGMDFCDDSTICGARKDTTKYASEKCGIFSSYVSTISKSGEGVQVQHSDDRLWQACAIYCKRSDTGGWYTPRLELNDLPISPYFPDGTFCHDDGSTKYYCQRHMCLEKDSRVARADKPDLNLSMNADPTEEKEIPELLGKYFSLDPNKKPIGGEYYGQDKEQDESEWEVKDYLN